MGLSIGGKPIATKNVSALIAAILELPLVKYRLYGEYTLTEPRKILQDAIAITAGEYAFITKDSRKHQVVSFDMTTCLQMTIFNPTTKELFHSHLNSAYSISWHEIFSLFSDVSNLEMQLIGGNAFVQRQGVGDNVSLINLQHLLASLLIFLQHHHFSINISAQMLLQHNMIFSPTLDFRSNRLSQNNLTPAKHYQRVMALASKNLQQGISAELMKDVVVGFSSSGHLQYDAIFPLYLRDEVDIPLARFAREWVGYGSLYIEEKLCLLGVCDGQQASENLADLKIPLSLLQQHLAKYSDIFLRWEQGNQEVKSALEKKIICPGSSVAERNEHIKFLRFAASNI